VATVTLKKQLEDSIRLPVVPLPKSTAKVGRDYNGQLIPFVEDYWKVEVAMCNSPSLQRAVNAVTTFEPIWGMK